MRAEMKRDTSGITEAAKWVPLIRIFTLFRLFQTPFVHFDCLQPSYNFFWLRLAIIFRNVVQILHILFANIGIFLSENVLYGLESRSPFGKYMQLVVGLRFLNAIYNVFIIWWWLPTKPTQSNTSTFFNFEGTKKKHVLVVPFESHHLNCWNHIGRLDLWELLELVGRSFILSTWW